MTSRKDELAALLSKERVLDSPQVLESYSRDQSFARAQKPHFIIKPMNADEVQKIVQWANRTKTPLIPLSSGPPHFHGDTVPTVSGAVIVDLSAMKKISYIDRRNRLVVIEPGVTYSELLPALAKEGMRLSLPLLPRSNKSVLASLLEREPRQNCRYQWSSMDPLRCVEIVFGDGNKLWAGGTGNDVLDLQRQWDQGKRAVDPTGPSQTDFYRFLSAAQGSIGIATWASLRCEILPSVHKLFFVPVQRLNDLLDFTYRVLKFRYADELFILNAANLAYMMGDSPAQIKALKEKLPPWMTLAGIAGRAELPEERVEFQEKDIMDIAGQLGLELKTSLEGVEGSNLLKRITNPSEEPYWKLRYKGGCQDIFFITTLDRAPEFAAAMQSEVKASGYPAEDTGVYLQPRHQGVNCHCEFNLPYDPRKMEEVSRIQQIYTRASKDMLDNGAFFTRPYGIWADMAFSKDAQSTALLKNIKNVFDPNNIMNPGKLCFKVQETKER